VLAGEEPAPPPAFKLEGHELQLPSPITFAPGSAELTAESTPALEHAQRYLEAKSYISTLRIEGHVAEAGDGAQALSEKRALAVARWLVAHGVDCARLVPVGFGATKPIADGATPEGKARNTRVVFVNAALRGRAIGGLPLEGGGSAAGSACESKP
jgi:OOP family OmpA-OmpF porin